MRFKGSESRTIILTVAIFLNIITLAHSEPFALLTSSNTIPTNPTLSRSLEVKTNQILPLIVMYDVPITTGIENLARQSKINYLIDNRLLKLWSSRDSNDAETSSHDSKWQRLLKWWFDDSNNYTNREPILNFRWKNLTVKQALLQVLKEHNLVLVENPITTVARITDANQAVNSVDFNLLGNDTNLIPLIQFEDVPITTGLKNLARQAVINYALDPKIGYGIPGQNGQIKAEPLLNFRWENITAKQAFVAICENYNLLAVKVSATNVIRIESKD